MLTILTSGLILAAQTAVVPPPPPEANYDPNPGPYVAIVDARGRPSDPGVLDNAIDSWRGPWLSAFILCFQPGRERYDPKTAFVSLRALSHALRTRGAAVVLIEPAYRCPSAPIDALAEVAHVEVRGVLRDAD